MRVILQNRKQFSEDEIKKIESFGYTVDYYENQVIDGDIFVGILKEPFSELDNIKGLRYIQSVIAGFDNLNLDDLKERNIKYCNASGVGSAPIAEYVTLKILDFYKRSEYYRTLASEGVWGSRKESDLTLEELTHKRVMVLGTGHIGQDISKRLKAFDCVLIGINSNGRAVNGFDETYALSDVYHHLDDVDVVVGALPLNEHTKDLYDEKFFKHMKMGSIFINVGRGPSLVLDDLIKALENNIAHAYLDVLPTEPLAKNSPLWRNKQISITPHNSSSSTLVKARTKQLILENLKRYAEDETLVNQVI